MAAVQKDEVQPGLVSYIWTLTSFANSMAVRAMPKSGSTTDECRISL